MLSAQQIAARLDDRFALLTDGGRTTLARQRTLEAAMDWSHELLPRRERKLLRRLSVFVGGFTLEAAEAVCSGVPPTDELGQGGVLDGLSRLADKSLVLVAERSGEARYRLLETIRQYGREKLGLSGEAAEIRRRHAGFMLQLAERAGSELKGPRQGEWLERPETEHDNLRAAMRWVSEEGASEDAARLAWALLYFTHPPRVVQKVLFAVLAPVARLLGYKGSHPEYGPSGFVDVDPWPDTPAKQTTRSTHHSEEVRP